MMDIEHLTSQIKHNCNISDAKYWGYYSLCGLLLRLRELYRAEKGIKPWEQIPQKDVGEWIAARESLWTELEDKDYERITVNGETYGPFEIDEINTALEEEGLIYGAGFGLHMKPSFFLADLISKEKIDGFNIYISGDEHAKDLSDYPAVLQDRAIFARTHPTKLLLWQRFEEMRCKGPESALAFAFSRYGIAPDEKPSEDIDSRISRTAVSEVETYIHHELGEAFEGVRLGDEWKAFLVRLSRGRPELFARAVKDVLSDTSERGMLKYIIQHQKEGSLGFYIVFLGGLRKIIFPEILDAFQAFVKTGDWQRIDDARKRGYKRAGEYTEKLLSMHREHSNDTSLLEAVENEILKGLL
jgi:hypothetical protein